MRDEVPLLATALACRCPRCGKGKLYRGLLTIAPTCSVCGLDLSSQDAGDGAAAFIILILGAIVIGLAFWVQMRFDPPIWVHVVLWTPITILGSIALMRPIKAALVILQYRTQRFGDPEI